MSGVSPVPSGNRESGNISPITVPNAGSSSSKSMKPILHEGVISSILDRVSLDRDDVVGSVASKTRFLELQDRDWVVLPVLDPKDAEKGELWAVSIAALRELSGEDVDTMWQIYQELAHAEGDKAQDSDQVEFSTAKSIIQGREIEKPLLTVIRGGYRYQFDLSRSSGYNYDNELARGGEKALIYPQAISGGAPHYLAGKLIGQRSDWKIALYGIDVLKALHAAGLKHIDHPPELVIYDVPGRGNVAILFVKRWNQGDLVHFRKGDVFQKLTPEQHIKLLQDVIEGQNELSEAKVIGVDVKPDNMGVNLDENGEVQIYFSDMDHVILPFSSREILSDSSLLDKLLSSVEREKRVTYTRGFMPSLQERYGLESKLKILSDALLLVKGKGSLVNAKFFGQVLNGAYKGLDLACQPIRSFQLGATLYETYTGQMPYPVEKGENFPDFSRFSREVQKNILLAALKGKGIEGERANQITDLILALIDPDPKKRMSVSEAYQKIQQIAKNQ